MGLPGSAPLLVGADGSLSLAGDGAGIGFFSPASSAAWSQTLFTPFPRCFRETEFCGGSGEDPIDSLLMLSPAGWRMPVVQERGTQFTGRIAIRRRAPLWPEPVS